MRHIKIIAHIGRIICALSIAQLSILFSSLPDDDFKKHFVERKERHGVNNVVTCDAPIVVLIYKNERANEDWVKIDVGIASMSIMMAAQNFGIESMCLGVVATKDTQEK